MVQVGEEENTHEHVPQHYLITSKQSQAPELLGLVQEATQEPNYKVIVFFTTARLTQMYAELFQAMGLAVLEIHSRRSQSQRNKVSDQFRDGTNMVLFTSDVTARGMDYPDVSAVIQVGQPADKAQYIHRLGRTARAGKQGCGVLVLCDFEQVPARRLPRVRALSLRCVRVRACACLSLMASVCARV